MSDKSRTLCVVDIQDYFDSSAVRLKQILKEIQLAKRRHAGIVVLEYDGCGRSNEMILKALRNYDRVRYKTKEHDDGSRELVRVAKQANFNLSKIRFCGVNRSYCVANTVAGFKSSKPNSDIEIAIDATWCSSPSSGRIRLKKYGRFVKTKV